MGWSRFLRRRYWHEERGREVEAYLEIETAENVSRGMSPGDARLAAQRKFGNTTFVREEIYRMNTLGLLETLWQDLRFAGRVLRKSPGFTIVTTLSLALGIGANTAMFSVVHAALLRALPYPNPSELVLVKGPNTAISIPELEFWKKNSASLLVSAGYRIGGEVRLTAGNEYQWIPSMVITTGFFRSLGVNPTMGREFNDDETHPGGPQAVILSDGLWRRSFGSDPAVLGRAAIINDAAYTVVGVLPQGFWFPQMADAFLALRPSGNLGDTGTNTIMIARLKPGVGLAQARAEMPAVTERFRDAYKGRISQKYRGLTVTPFQEYLVGDVRLNLLLLFGAVGFLLLIACANLTSLLLTRLASRSKEIAVRLAMGSSAGRLLRQFLMENFVLAVLGGAGGLLVAYFLLHGLLTLMPFDLHSSSPVRLDRTVLLFTLGIGVVASLVFTLIPFVASGRMDLHEALKSGGRSSGAGPRKQTRNVLVVAEVALSVTLLISAGLLIKTLYRLHQEQLGFNPEGLITFETPLGPGRHTAEDLNRFQRDLSERFQHLPGVRSVAAINVLPLNGWSNLPTQREGHNDQSIGGMEIRAVTPSYFETMGIPVRQGRTFTATDPPSSPPMAVINETLARTWWKQGSAIGDRLVIGSYEGKVFPDLKELPREVIGVVADTKTSFLKSPARPTIFIPTSQPGVFTNSCVWVVRAGGTAGVAGELRRAILEFNPQQRIRQFRTMTEVVASTTAESRFDAWLFAIFAGVALLLTAVGVYGLLSFTVAQRRQEIGTRMALGANRGDVVKLILKQGLALTVLGLALGVGASLLLSKSLSDLLYGVRPHDPWNYVLVSVLLILVALAASCIPARRATAIDPLTALRYE